MNTLIVGNVYLTYKHSPDHTQYRKYFGDGQWGMGSMMEWKAAAQITPFSNNLNKIKVVDCISSIKQKSMRVING